MSNIDKILRKVGFREGWIYVGVTNDLISKHSWTNGEQVLNVYNATGYFVVEVESKKKESKLKLSNCKLSLREALILADKYMSDEKRDPAAFMLSYKVSSSKKEISQEKWLDKHKKDYNFDVIESEKILS